MILRIFFLSLLVVSAGEYKIDLGEVRKTAQVEVKLLPDQAVPIIISTEEWSDLTVASHVEHGAAVKEGEPLITLKKEIFEQTVVDLKNEIALNTIELDLMKKSLIDKEALTPLALEKLEVEKKRFDDDLTYYLKTEMPHQKESYDRFIENAEWDLLNANEELTQLKKMYEEDDLTDETEEIILKRSEFRKRVAEFRVKGAKDQFTRLKEVRVARNVEDKKHSEKVGKYNYEERKRALPMELEQLKLEIMKKEAALQRSQEKLAKLERDAALIEVTAPVSGTFFYGLIKNGAWSGASTTEKFMLIGGKVPRGKEFACIIPEKAETFAFAQVEAKSLGSLKSGLSGSMIINGQEENTFQVSCDSVSPTPLTNGKFLATFSYPASTETPYTLEGKAKLLISEKSGVLRLPKKALKTLPNGTQQVQLLPVKAKKETKEEDTQDAPEAEDRTEAGVDASEEEKTPDKKTKSKEEEPVVKEETVSVKVGLHGDEYVEVISGLKEGDVVKVP